MSCAKTLTFNILQHFMTEEELWSREILEKETQKNVLLIESDRLHSEMRKLREEIDAIKSKQHNRERQKYWVTKQAEWYPYLPFVALHRKLMTQITTSSPMFTVLAQLILEFCIDTDVPSDYKIWYNKPGTFGNYHVSYNDVHMEMSVGPDLTTPSYHRLISCLPYLSLPFLKTVSTTRDEYATLVKARELCPQWKDKFDFGLLLFRDWYRHFRLNVPDLYIWDDIEKIF